MKKLILISMMALFASSAFATTYSCSPANSPSSSDPAVVPVGSVMVECNSNVCALDGKLSNVPAEPSTMTFDKSKCIYEVRTGVNPKVAVKKPYIYLDKKSDECWADYIRLYKSLATTGTGYISLTKTTGGDTHDDSGYQYVSLSCEAK